MPYKNPTQILIAATSLPAAIEAKLPAGAPKISTTLVDIATKLPAVPDLPIEIPDLPAVPMLPAMPMLPEMPGELRRMVTGVEVKPVGAPSPERPVATRPTAEKIPLVFE